jgi:hypothetical protein
MVLIKVYFLGGLILLGAAIVLAEKDQSGLLAYGGVLALALGMLQVYVALPVGLKVALSLCYFAGMVALIVGGNLGLTPGRVLTLLALGVHAVGVMRFPGRAKG